MAPSAGTEAGTDREPLRPAPVPRGSTEAAVPVPAGVRPVTVPERVAATVKRASTGALEAVRELWLREGRLLHVLWHGKPESMAEHRAYMKSRAWVPKEMTGKPATFFAWAGIIYHLIIARPLKAAAKTIDAAASRPLLLLCLTVFIVALIFLLARYS